MPWDTETYLHRVGRAGRFGNYGLAVSFVTSGKEESKLLGIADEIKYKIELISGKPFLNISCVLKFSGEFSAWLNVTSHIELCIHVKL